MPVNSLGMEVIMGLGPPLMWGETHHSPRVHIPSYARVKPEVGPWALAAHAHRVWPDVSAKMSRPVGGTATEAVVDGRGVMERILCWEERGSPGPRLCEDVRVRVWELAWGSWPHSHSPLSPACARRETGGALPLLHSLTFHFIFSHGPCVSSMRTFSPSYNYPHLLWLCFFPTPFRWVMIFPVLP